MNPWMSEQLAAAHRDELRRVAAGVSYPRPERSRPEKNPDHVLAPRRRLGALLIRVGTRLEGVEASRLTPSPPGVAC